MDKSMSRWHALCILTYYTCGCVAMIMLAHPVLLGCLWILFLMMSFFSFGIVHAGKRILADVGLGVLTIGFNMLVNHRGPTVLFSIGRMRFTKESAFFGLQAAVLLIVCIHFLSHFSKKMTDEKILSLMAGRLPGVALVFTMSLRLVPEIRRDMKRYKSFHGRGIRSFKAVISKAGEDGILRSISMRDRGYESGKKRTGFYRQSLSPADIILILSILLWTGACIWIKCLDVVNTRYFPTIHMDSVSWFVIAPWVLYYSIPMIIMIKEEAAWRISKRKITPSTITAQEKQP